MSIQEEKFCRYCLRDDNINDLVSPCKCAGTSQYVHQACLVTWLDTKNHVSVLPFRQARFDLYKCEVCNHKYSLETVKQPLSGLYWKIFGNIMLITICLFISYSILGFVIDSANKDVVFYDTGSKVGNILLDGAVVTHMLLSIVYIIVITRSVYYCFFMPDVGRINCDECCIGLVVTVLVVFTIMLYVDIISAVIKQHENSCTKVVIVHNYEPSENLDYHILINKEEE